jgi:hypothetical protein
MLQAMAIRRSSWFEEDLYNLGGSGDMQSIVKKVLYLFIIITFITALLTLVGIAYVWFISKSNNDLPYLKWLIGLTVVEIVSVVVLIGKKGIHYLPEIRIDKNKEDTYEFMEKFISIGTSACIVSNRASWLTSNDKLINILKKKIDSGLSVDLITAKEIPIAIREKLKGVNFFIIKDNFVPEARFTLINSERSGAEKLAISRGVHPNHEISIFDNSSGPQIIAMAKDIIRNTKELSNAE